MKNILHDSVARLRLIALLEGTSLLLLTGVAVPAKHVYDYPVLVKIAGPVHGMLFLLFMLYALQTGIEQQWKSRTTWKVLLASFVPFGTFYIERTILRKIDTCN